MRLPKRFDNWLMPLCIITMSLSCPHAFSYSDFDQPAGPIPESFEDDPNVEGPFYERPSRQRKSGHARTMISFGPELGAGSVGLLVSVTRITSRFFGWEASGFYRSRKYDVQQSEITLTHHGAEVSLRAHLLNPTMITPYVGAGPGWESWQRQADGDSFDDASSPLAIYYVGAMFALSPHFSLGLRQKTINYLGKVPKDWEDNRRVGRSQSSLQIQFLFGF